VVEVPAPPIVKEQQVQRVVPVTDVRPSRADALDTGIYISCDVEGGEPVHSEPDRKDQAQRQHAASADGKGCAAAHSGSLRQQSSESVGRQRVSLRIHGCVAAAAATPLHATGARPAQDVQLDVPHLASRHSLTAALVTQNFHGVMLVVAKSQRGRESEKNRDENEGRAPINGLVISFYSQEHEILFSLYLSPVENKKDHTQEHQKVFLLSGLRTKRITHKSSKSSSLCVREKKTLFFFSASGNKKDHTQEHQEGFLQSWNKKNHTQEHQTIFLLSGLGT
jgi:hypothetical protein